MTFYINEKERHASSKLGALLTQCMELHPESWDEITLLCIGSDRITGDSLGPLIGHQLSRCHLPDIHVYGTLKDPVHALNLKETTETIAKKHPHSLVIAIDASLGTKKHIGYVSIGNGSIFPGAGVHKTLPPVGDIFITGIVNFSGAFEHLLLQTTRLSTIVAMADLITSGILLAYARCFDHPRVLPNDLFHLDEDEDESGRIRIWAKDSLLAASAAETESASPDEEDLRVSTGNI